MVSGYIQLACKYIILLFFFTSIASAETIYVFENSEGSLSFSDSPEHGGYEVYYQDPRQIILGGVQQIIEHYAFYYKLDANLIRAIIKVESNYDPKALSRAGAQGLMQLMPKTAQLVGVRNPFDPHENIRGGVQYLHQLYRQYNGKLKMVLAAYNAGPTAVKKYGGIPPYPETITYIKRVLRYYRQSRTS